jgi:hypothetical protein
MFLALQNLFNELNELIYLLDSLSYFSSLFYALWDGKTFIVLSFRKTFELALWDYLFYLDIFEN